MNESYIKFVFYFFILIIILLTVFFIIGNINYNNIEKDKERIYYQIQYLNNKILDMFNLVNENEWQILQNNIKELYVYWNSSILEINTLNIDKKYIVDFGKTLDYLAISIKNEDHKVSLNYLIELYKMVIIYAEGLNYNENYINILYTKHNLITARSILATGNWTMINEYILKASEYIFEVVKDVDNNLYNQYNINQTYVAIKEMENLVNIKDVDWFIFKYDIAIEKLKKL